MSDSWLHMYSFVSAYYGHFADLPNPDLDLSLSDGSLDERRRQDASESIGSLVNSKAGSVSSRKIKPLWGRSYPDEALSRDAQKKQKENEVKEARSTNAITARLANAIEHSSDIACEKEALAAVQEVGTELRVTNRLWGCSITYTEKYNKIG